MEARARKLQKKVRKTDLFKIMKRHGRDRLTSGIWERALNAEDPLTVELIDDAVGALGAGIASAVNLLDVEAGIIGGGVRGRAGGAHQERARRAEAPPPPQRARPPPGRGAPPPGPRRAHGRPPAGTRRPPPSA